MKLLSYNIKSHENFIYYVFLIHYDYQRLAVQKVTYCND